jgi:uncharacterized iron-regulated protein
MNLPSLALAFGVAWTPVSVSVPEGVPVHPADAAPIIVIDANGATRTWDEAVADLATARVVAVGEQHNLLSHHLIQADVLKALAARTPRLAVGFEMVSIDQQPILDAYMSGKTPEAEFAVWWKKVWGQDFAIYKPIFDAAKAAGASAYALNAPLNLVRAVSKGGLASLPPADRARLPAVIEESSDPRYREYVKQSVSGHGPLTPEQLKNRLQSMAVWNETMGERAAAIAASGRTVLVIAGQGHVLYKAGLAESAQRRGSGPVKVLLPWSEMPAKDELALSDWFRLIEKAQTTDAQDRDDLWHPLTIGF